MLSYISSHTTIPNSSSSSTRHKKSEWQYLKKGKYLCANFWISSIFFFYFWIFFFLVNFLEFHACCISQIWSNVFLPSSISACISYPKGTKDEPARSLVPEGLKTSCSIWLSWNIFMITISYFMIIWVIWLREETLKSGWRVAVLIISLNKMYLQQDIKTYSECILFLSCQFCDPQS